MSMYNILFGQNPNTEVLLAIIGLKECDVERFRDCGFEEGGIFVYTRTGGGNRDDYPNEILTGSPYYLRDEDDDFDSTYATYHFNIPEEVKEDVELFRNVRENGITGKLIKWVLKTIEREPTEGDVYTKNYQSQQKLLSTTNSYGVDFFTMNGHTIIPLNDGFAERLFKAAEEADGNFYPYSIRPFRVLVGQNVPRYQHDKDDICTIKIDTDWKVDPEIWDRWRTKYELKYPKTFAKLSEDISKITKI